MKRGGPLQRKTPMQRSSTPMKRSGKVRAKRPTPRRREAPRWGWEEWEAADRVLRRRSRGRCERCGTDRGPFERHHRKRRRDGGDRFSNVMLICVGCHRHVTEHPAEARRFGWIVSVARDPVEVPMLQFGAEWVTLDDAGQSRPLYGPVVDAHD